MSQDHLEIFFSAVRSKGGYSNNPTCYQFINILKKLLVHADVKESKHANCTSLDETSLLQIASKTKVTKTEDSLNPNFLLETDNVISEHDDFYGKGKNKKYIDNTVIHIAGFVTRTILRKSRCFHCPLLLTSEISHSSLTEKKSRRFAFTFC